ncbi:MAG: hypothetical protein HOP02_03245, partial [Methylococcaceae bacterium]|nr:hypothetical protein [Methylococcaceae bacterium]
ILMLTLFSTPLLAENEATFEPSIGTVIIPQVIIPGDQEPTRVNVIMKRKDNGDFTVIKADKTTASLDTAIEKYVTLAIKEGRLVYGQMLKRTYPSNTSPQPTNETSLPYYVTNYAQGVEIRIYNNAETLSDTTLAGKALTDSNGFYQIALKNVGLHRICFGSTNDSCGTFISGEGGAFSQRCDFTDFGNSSTKTQSGNFCTTSSPINY